MLNHQTNRAIIHQQKLTKSSSSTHLLDKSSNLLLDLLKPGLRVGRFGGVHLVHRDDQLLHTQGVGKQSVLPGQTQYKLSSFQNHLVCPFFEMPASNSPVPEAMMRTPQSAWLVPVIIFLMKSRWPGASMMVT